MREKETFRVSSNFFGTLEIDPELAKAESSANPRKGLSDLCEALNEAVFVSDEQKIVLAHGAFMVRYANNKHGFEPYHTTHGMLSGFRVTIDNKVPYLVADIVPFDAESTPDDDEDKAILWALMISSEQGYDNYSITFDTGVEPVFHKIDEWSQVVKTSLLQSSNIFSDLHEALVYDIFVNEVLFMREEPQEEDMRDISNKIIGSIMALDVPAIDFVLSTYLDADEPAMSVICERSYESVHTYSHTPPEISFVMQENSHCVEGSFVGITIEPVEKTIVGNVMVRPRPLLILRDYENGNLVQIPLSAISEYSFGSDASHDQLVPSQRPALSKLEAIAEELNDIDITSGD